MGDNNKQDEIIVRLEMWYSNILRLKHKFGQIKAFVGVFSGFAVTRGRCLGYLTSQLEAEWKKASSIVIHVFYDCRMNFLHLVLFLFHGLNELDQVQFSSNLVLTQQDLCQNDEQSEASVS